MSDPIKLVRSICYKVYVDESTYETYFDYTSASVAYIALKLFEVIRLKFDYSIIKDSGIPARLNNIANERTILELIYDFNIPPDSTEFIFHIATPRRHYKVIKQHDSEYVVSLDTWFDDESEMPITSEFLTNSRGAAVDEYRFRELVQYLASYFPLTNTKQLALMFFENETSIREALVLPKEFQHETGAKYKVEQEHRNIHVI